MLEFDGKVKGRGGSSSILKDGVAVCEERLS